MLFLFLPEQAVCMGKSLQSALQQFYLDILPLGSISLLSLVAKHYSTRQFQFGSSAHSQTGISTAAGL